MSTIFRLTAQQLFQRAYRMLGILNSDGQMTDDQVNQAIIALNLMLQGWQADGINIWRQTQMSISVGANQGGPGNPVILDPPIMGLENASWVQSFSPLYKRLCGIYTYNDYNQISNPTESSGSGPSVVMMQKNANQTELYLWPLPTYGGTLVINVGRSVDAVTDQSQTVDVPQEWQETVLYNLASRLVNDDSIGTIDPATAQNILELAGHFYQKLLDFDRPNAVYVRPVGKPARSPYYR